MYRYLNVGKLIPELQDMVDNRIINIAAVDIIAQLDEDEQETFALVLDEKKVTFSADMAKQLKVLIDNQLKKSYEDIKGIFERKKTVQKPVQHSISSSVVNKYFSSDTSDKQIEDTIAKALELYFNQNAGT